MAEIACSVIRIVKYVVQEKKTWTNIKAPSGLEDLLASPGFPPACFAPCWIHVKQHRGPPHDSEADRGTHSCPSQLGCLHTELSTACARCHPDNVRASSQSEENANQSLRQAKENPKEEPGQNQKVQPHGCEAKSIQKNA